MNTTFMRVLKEFVLIFLFSNFHVPNHHEVLYCSKVNLEFVKPEALDQYHAAVWLLSPPCQPYNSCLNCLLTTVFLMFDMFFLSFNALHSQET